MASTVLINFWSPWLMETQYAIKVQLAWWLWTISCLKLMKSEWPWTKVKEWHWPHVHLHILIQCTTHNQFYLNQRLQLFLRNPLGTCVFRCFPIKNIRNQILTLCTVKRSKVNLGTSFEQTTGIPMGTNCAPLVADLCLFCYERDIMKSSWENQADIIEALQFCFQIPWRLTKYW